MTMHQPILDDDYMPPATARAVSASPILPRAARVPASAGILDARGHSYAASLIGGAMHADFRPYYAPLSAARVTIAKACRLPARRNQNIMPARERASLEPARAQYDYMLYLDGCLAGTIEVIELEPGLAFVGWVHVERHATGLGLGLALHHRVLEDFDALAVEDFCSRHEQYTLAALHRRGARITESRDQAHLGITRGCRVVDRMYVVTDAAPLTGRADAG